jgi:hypothetical protein
MICHSERREPSQDRRETSPRRNLAGRAHGTMAGRPEVLRGYMPHDRVLRPAMVVLGNGIGGSVVNRDVEENQDDR